MNPDITNNSATPPGDMQANDGIGVTSPSDQQNQPIQQDGMIDPTIRDTSPPQQAPVPDGGSASPDTSVTTDISHNSGSADKPDGGNPLKALAQKLSNLKDGDAGSEESAPASPVADTTQPGDISTPTAATVSPDPVADPSVVAAGPEVNDPSPITDTPNQVDASVVPGMSPSAEPVPTITPDPMMPVDNSSQSIPDPLQNTVTPQADPAPMHTPDPNMQSDPISAPTIEDSGKSLETILDEEDAASTSSGDEMVNEGPYQFDIHQLLSLVVERDASDLHITVGYPAMIRVDGALQPVTEQIVTEEQANDLIMPVLPEQKKELLEVNREVDLAYAHGENARFRINAYYQKQSLAAAFRLIPNRIRSIDELKLPQIYHQIAKLKQGLVLVTGPTGSGKSTTLAAILQEINQTRPDHLITIEDPIEYVFPKAKAMVDQREMHEDTHSWEIALKSALRQDPDVMLVGEMRDYETIAAAITLAETGHLVFATLHTNSASQTVDRIIDVFPEHQQPQVRSQLSHVIESVVAQRLIPLPSGGRSAVSEIMIANPAIRNLIREAKTHQIDNVIRTSADIGMVSLEHSLVKLVRENMITMDIAQEYAVHPEEVVRLLKS